MIVIVRCCNDELAQQLEPYISALGAASLSQATQIVIQFLEESVLMASSVGWPSQRSDFCMHGLAKASSCTSSWHLARSKWTVIWDRRNVMPVMFSSQGVVKGPLEAFESQLQDSETWCAMFHMLRIESA